MATQSCYVQYLPEPFSDIIWCGALSPRETTTPQGHTGGGHHKTNCWLWFFGLAGCSVKYYEASCLKVYNYPIAYLLELIKVVYNFKKKLSFWKHFLNSQKQRTM